jgi:hypothetical protein
VSPVRLSRSVRYVALILAAWSVTLALRALPIGGEWAPLGADVWVALFGWLIAYLSSFAIVFETLPARRRAAPPAALAWENRWIALLSLIAIAGAFLIAFDFAVLRGYGFGTPVALVRSEEVANVTQGQGGSFVSACGRLFTPALQIAWVLVVVRWRTVWGRVKLLLGLATFTVFAEQTFYEGGRFFLATLIVNCLVARGLGRSSAPVSTAPPRRRSLRTVIVGVVAVVGFGAVFLNRAAALNIDLSSVYLLYTRTFDVDVGAAAIARLDGGFGALWFVAAMFWIYVTQGANELAVLMNAPQLAHAHGFFQFPQVAQAINMFGGAGVGYDVFTELPNPGTYNTFVGAGYIDFGHLGSIVFALLLGALTALSLASFDRRRLGALSLCAPLFVTLGVFSPVISLVTNLWPAMVWASVVGWTVHSRRRAASSGRAHLTAGTPP